MDTKKILVAMLCLTAFTSSIAQIREVSPAAAEPTVTFLSGGVGDDAMAQLVAREQEFDLKLFLVGQSGTYLSDIRITITDARGKGVLLTTSEGPILLANLPTGTYNVKAQTNGHTLEQKVSVTSGKLQTTYLRFPGE